MFVSNVNHNFNYHLHLGIHTIGGFPKFECAFKVQFVYKLKNYNKYKNQCLSKSVYPYPFCKN